ncbi:DUF2848 domain-containing protein [Granulosicoccus sp. 3-233]|uniref:DUF2848 domain-containing protein n=1 Tax=Granulosicoccus sp. 3-233 TaxID=3417969 RepID=UPI003D3556EA
MIFTCDKQSITLQPQALTIAGWTGRNPDAVQHHIDELKALGIAPPSQVPLYYRVSQALLTQDEHITVLGSGSSGEVEPLLIHAEGELWLGLASDHTDRELEAHSVAASKQACAKPCARDVWRYADVRDHLDELVLSCDIREEGEWVNYQQGKLDSIRPLDELLAGHALAAGAAMLCGTLGAIGGVRPAREYRMSIEDPVRNRRIDMSYNVSTLPIIN